MAEIRLHPTTDQREARDVDVQRAIQRAREVESANRQALACLSAEAAINATAAGPFSRIGDAARWLLAVESAAGRVVGFAAFSDELDLTDATLDWLEGMADDGDDDGWFPIVRVDEPVRVMLEAAVRYRRQGSTIPLAPAEGAAEEILLLDRLSDPLGTLTISEGAYLHPVLGTMIDRMVDADDERRVEA